MTNNRNRDLATNLPLSKRVSAEREARHELLASKRIGDLIANLYSYCAERFHLIQNLVRNDEPLRIAQHSAVRELVMKLVGIGGHLLDSDIQDILSVLEQQRPSSQEEFVLGVWAFLKAIDEVVAEDVRLQCQEWPLQCESSSYFGGRKFMIIPKPRNVIFEEIKNRHPEDSIKRGSDIGQRIDDELNHIILYEEHISKKIALSRIDPLVDQLLRDRGADLRIAVIPISCGYDYSFKPYFHADGTSYVFDEVTNESQIEELIHAFLERCAAGRIGIIVFPELAVTEPLGNSIAQWLQNHNKDQGIVMVVAGSYHVRSRPSEKYENVATVYRYDGKVLWQQKKMHQFQLDEGDIEEIRNSKAKGFDSFKAILRPEDKKAWEQIEVSNQLVLMDSTIGRMAVAICLDFFVLEKEKLYIQPSANIIFMPSMSPSLKKAHQAENDIGTYGLASVFCSNSCWAISGGDPTQLRTDDLSYIYVPKKGGRMQLTCVRDCERCAILEYKIGE